MFMCVCVCVYIYIYIYTPHLNCKGIMITDSDIVKLLHPSWVWSNL